MSRNKAAAVSAFRLLLRPSTAPRSRNLLALRLAPVTTFALHLRPGHEMQQHRGYASSAQDDETKGGQKSDQHQKQLETGGPKSCQDEAEAKSNKYHLSSRDDESDNAIGSKNPASSLVSAELREEVRRLVRQLFERLRSRETCSRSESRVIKCPRSEGYKNAVPNHNSDELSCQKEVMGDRAGSQAPGKLANRIEKFKKRRSHKPARVKVLNARELAHIKRELCKQMQSKKKVTSRSRKKARMKLDQVGQSLSIHYRLSEHPFYMQMKRLRLSVPRKKCHCHGLCAFGTRAPNYWRKIRENKARLSAASREQFNFWTRPRGITYGRLMQCFSVAARNEQISSLNGVRFKAIGQVRKRGFKIMIGENKAHG
ncbi:uncharacterized protein LOC6506183 isoform X8 [Drosophila ananassae]|uniref:uncharacterized protein LOC6506183 isoform X8 n=1 Tax=Drosophila ananassae TaxID=7217 RepID=UPI0013A5DABD|nr:uncharacterized protein LOC6506183 isoform X8 [Drosophila ananassae]